MIPFNMPQKKRDNNKSDSRDSKKGKFDMNPFSFIEQCKNKLQIFYTKLQKERKIRVKGKIIIWTNWL